MSACPVPPPLCADALDMLALGVIVLDESERVVIWNRWLADASGQPGEAVLGRRFVEIFPDLAEHRIHEAIHDALHFGHPALISHSLHRSPFPLVRGSQQQRIEQSVQVAPFVSGPIRYCLVQINDVTFSLERERVLRSQTMELREAQQRQLALLNGIAEMAWLKDHSGHYVAVNQTYAEVLGTSPEKMTGRTDFDFYPEGIATRHQLEDAEVMKSLGVRRTEELQYGSEGRERWMEIVRAPVIGPSGGVIGTAGTARDVTERKLAEVQVQRLNAELEIRVRKRTAQLEQANEALLNSNMELDRFAHIAAHDLQTPLRSIVGFAQLLQQEIRGRVDERVDEWSSLVVENAKRLQTLIQELLAYSRLGIQGRPFQTVNLRRLFDEVRASLADLIEQYGAEVSSGELPVVAADRTQIAQLLQNLVENGIKFNASDKPQVHLSCQRQGDEWVFSVADNGIGIDSKFHKHIFESFRRLHSYSQMPGTGLGLAICQRIVERHGGRIWVESRKGHGSNFIFTLPAARGPE